MTDMTKNTSHLRTIKSYAIRAGRMTKTQKQALDNLYCEHGLDINNPNKITDFINKSPTVIEIGFGMGDSFISQVINTNKIYNNNIQFLGIEVHPPGVGNTLNLIDTNNLPNCKIIQHDAIDILNNIIKDNTLTGLQLFFPDPWPKTRHNKRRIVNTNFLNLIKNKFKDKSYFHFATDWEPYAQYVIDLIKQFPEFKLVTYKDLNKNLNINISPRPETKFERRGSKLGHEIFDLIYILDK